MWQFCMEMVRFQFVFQKICFKVKVLATDCYIKAYQSLERKAILKVPSTIFLKEPTALSLALKWNFYEKAFSSAKTKTNPNFAVALAERSIHSVFYYLFEESHISNICAPWKFLQVDIRDTDSDSDSDSLFEVIAHYNLLLNNNSSKISLSTL